VIFLIRKAEEDNVLYHPAGLTTPVMFSFRPKFFFGQKKASIRIEDSDWSDRFSLDAAGSAGTVLCRSDNRSYQLGVHIQLSNEGLTKQVSANEQLPPILRDPLRHSKHCLKPGSQE